MCALFEDGRARQALVLHERFGAEYVNARLPAWFSFLWGSVRLVAPIKRAVQDGTPDVRPAGIGEPRQVACVSHVMDTWKQRAAERLWPQQVAIGIPGGIHLLAFGLRAALETHRGWVLLKLDFKNAVNEMKRAAVFRSVAEGFDGEFRDLLPLLKAHLELKSCIFLGDNEKARAAFDSEEGMQQGSGEGPPWFLPWLAR